MKPRNERDFFVKCDVLYTPCQQLEDRLLRISNGRIAEILHEFSNAGASAPVLHEPGAIVAPGFIDLHVHGAGGRDLMDGSAESLQTVSSTLARHGTTSFLATTLSAPDSDTEVVVRGFAQNRERIADGAEPLGIHMEGPYLNPDRRGTHNSRYLSLPNLTALRQFAALSCNSVLKMTIAPELEGALALIREAVGMGIQISMGHSDATLEQARAAVEAGASQATHLFNTMRPFHHREPGIVGLVLTDDRVSAEIIADGIHVHPSAIKMLIRMKGVERTILITDGLSAVDMPQGRYPLGDKMVRVEGGACRDEDGTLAGSTLTLDCAVKNLVRWFDLPLQDALSAAGATPARCMRFGGKGVIAVGADADLVFLDSKLDVLKTMVAGRIVYSAQ